MDTDPIDLEVDPLDPALVLDVLRPLYGELHDLRLDARPLRGGLVSEVVLLSARFVDAHDRPGRHRIVVKTLEGRETREAGVYGGVLRETDLAPRPLGIHRVGTDRVLLFLEAVRPAQAWPWREVGAARHVLERTAALHELDMPAALAERLGDWDYEAELVRQGLGAIELLERARLAPFRGGLPPLRRLVDRVSAVRRQLVDFDPSGGTLLHGDLHSGNVIVPAGSEGAPVVFVDWARARLGSPLEDVSSWLQSLGCWEPVAKQRHDTLLKTYLAARGHSAELTPDLRSAYWLAGACNALGGALLHHLRIATEGRGAAASEAVQAARGWLRIVRRADACWA